MNHDSMKELIFALYDGESSLSDREKALSHMKTCAECRQVIWEFCGADTEVRIIGATLEREIDRVVFMLNLDMIGRR